MTTPIDEIIVYEDEITPVLPGPVGSRRTFILYPVEVIQAAADLMALGYAPQRVAKRYRLSSPYVYRIRQGKLRQGVRPGTTQGFVDILCTTST